MSKLEEKRQKIFQDRLQRLMNQGMTAEQARAKIYREDYDSLPVETKIDRLEGMFVGNVQGLAEDMSTLKQNQIELADVMDINFRAFEMMLEKLGLSEQLRQEIFNDAEHIWKEEQEKRAADLKAQEEDEAKKTLAETVDQPGQAQAPEGATVYGG